MNAPLVARAELDDRIRQCDAAVRHWVLVANHHAARLGRPVVTVPPVRYDLRGRTAGQWRRRGGYLRLNIDLIQTAFGPMLNETVPHEVAHAVVSAWYGLGVKPHGQEWRGVMALFGKRPDVCHRLETRPARKVRRFAYRCRCPERVYHLTTIKHRRQQAGSGRYYCTHCKYPLIRG